MRRSGILSMSSLKTLPHSSTAKRSNKGDSNKISFKSQMLQTSFNLKILKQQKLSFDENFGSSQKIPKINPPYLKEPPIKMRFKEHKENNPNKKFEIKTIVGYHKVFQNEKNKLYQNDYINKMFRLMHNKPKKYHMKRKLLELDMNRSIKEDLYLTSGAFVNQAAKRLTIEFLNGENQQQENQDTLNENNNTNKNPKNLFTNEILVENVNSIKIRNFNKKESMQLKESFDDSDNFSYSRYSLDKEKKEKHIKYLRTNYKFFNPKINKSSKPKLNTTNYHTRSKNIQTEINTIPHEYLISHTTKNKDSVKSNIPHKIFISAFAKSNIKTKPSPNKNIVAFGSSITKISNKNLTDNKNKFRKNRPPLPLNNISNNNLISKVKIQENTRNNLIHQLLNDFQNKYFQSR